MNRFTLAVAGVVFASAQGAFAANDMVGVNFNGDIYKIDSAAGTAFLVGPSGFGALNSAATLGGFAYTADGTGLVRIDPTTFIASRAVNFSGLSYYSLRGMAFSAAGECFVIQNGGSAGSTDVPDELYKLNIATGTFTFVGTTSSFVGIQGLDFAPNGTLYAWDIFNGLLKIDPNTGAATDVSGVGGDGSIQTIAFGANGTLYGGRDNWFSIDTATGATTLISSGQMNDVRGATPFGATVIKVPPSGFNVIRGALVSGDLNSLLTSDDNYLVVRNGPVALKIESPITVDVNASTSYQTVASMKVRWENKVSISGLEQRLEMKNYLTNAFVQLDRRAASTTDTEIVVDVPSPNEYIEAATHARLARLRVNATGPLFTNTWSMRCDFVGWEDVR